MAIRPLIELRTDLIDSLSAFGGLTRDSAILVVDQIIDSAGFARTIGTRQVLPAMLQTPMVSLLDSMTPQNQELWLRRAGLFEGGATGALAATGASNGPVGATGAPSIGVNGPTGAPIPLMELVPGPSFHATRAEFRRMAGGLPMWKGGPPRPGWLAPGLLLARRDDDLLYRVSGLSDKVDFKRLMGMPGIPGYTTEYRNLHKSWRATEFILCDDCRATPESDVVCDSCAGRRLRKTGDERWELPKFCDVAYDDPRRPPPTRFERDEVI